MNNTLASSFLHVPSLFFFHNYPPDVRQQWFALSSSPPKSTQACLQRFHCPNSSIGQGLGNLTTRLHDPHLVPRKLAVKERVGPAPSWPVEPSSNTSEREVFGGFRACLP